MIENFFSVVVYIFLFSNLYIWVFFLITFFEELPSITNLEDGELTLFPSVTIIIPCWNEESTVSGTIESVLALDYPKDKLNLIVVDDGSTDNTWQVIQKFANYPQVTISKKENGGKHDALNHGLAMATTDLVGCLDADSFVEKNALTEMVRVFNGDKEIMAVTPTIIVKSPETIIQKMQHAEYNIVAFLRRMQSPLDAIQVAPGPFSIFKREVFEKIGIYKKAYNMEDMELTLRMQANHMKIRSAHKAHVYTVPPHTTQGLYKQRLRWVSGGIKNNIDYRFMFFKRDYGIFGMLMLPLSFSAVFVFLYNFGFLTTHLIHTITNKVVEISTIGFSALTPHFDVFFFSTDFAMLLSYVFLLLTIVLSMNGAKIVTGKFQFSKNIIYLVVFYGFLAPFWVSRGVFNATFHGESKWR